MMLVSTNEELCRILQFIDHLVQQRDISEMLFPAAGLSNCICETSYMLFDYILVS